MINSIIEIYHTAQKKRHDLLVEDLAVQFPDFYIEDISECIQEIEKIVQQYVNDASDSLYGLLPESAVKKKISEDHSELNGQTIEIIFERAKYYASR